MANKIVLGGYEEFIADLRRLPTELTGEAQDIVDRAAAGTGRTVESRYARGPTGNLKAGVVTQLGVRGKFIASSRAMTAAPHASLYENGTKVRTIKARGLKYRKKANRGQMKPARVFVRVAAEHRTVMEAELRALVESKGLQVTGSL